MKCSKCGKEVAEDAKFCPSCGEAVVVEEIVKEEVEQAPAAPPPAAEPAAPVTSSTVEDPFLKKWNWGAFLLSWIWAFGHGLAMWGVIGLVACFVPAIGSLVALGIAIYLGIKGNELAWQTGKYLSIDELKEKEKKWTKWAVIIFIISIVLAVLLTVLGIIMAITFSANTSIEYMNEYMLFL